MAQFLSHNSGIIPRANFCWKNAAVFCLLRRNAFAAIGGMAINNYKRARNGCNT